MMGFFDKFFDNSKPSKAFEDTRRDLFEDDDDDDEYNKQINQAIEIGNKGKEKKKKDEGSSWF